MGAAKRRGTFEERVDEARERFEAGIEVRKKELEEMNALERRQTEAMGNFLNQRVLPQMERQHGALMRADFTQIPLTVTKESLDKQSV